MNTAAVKLKSENIRSRIQPQTMFAIVPDIVGVGNVLEALIVFGIFIFEVLTLVKLDPTSIFDTEPFGDDPDHRRNCGLAAPHEQTPPERYMNERRYGGRDCDRIGRLGVLRTPFGIRNAGRQENSVGHAWPSHAASVHAASRDPNGANRH